CRDCVWAAFRCHTCIVSSHAELPCHIIEKWNGQYFGRVSLKALGLCLQFGHSARGQCPKPVPDDHFIIIHGNGRHEVAIDYCGCLHARSHSHQLREARLIPMGPGAAVTHKAVEMCRML
ncbi:hypothetical protein FB451DRAFT_964715, partial [Mycena latifolia]